MIDILMEVVSDAVLDCVKALPFLLLAFLLMEAAEKYYGRYINRILKRSQSAGPAVGALLGCVPQCGFSIMASNLYAGGMITLGTLLAVFLSTSDEAILLMMANPERSGDILRLIGVKILIAVIAGYGVDLLLRGRKKEHTMDQICVSCHCHEEQGIFKAALRHTIRLFGFLLLFTIALNLILEVVGMEKISAWLLGDTVFQPILAAVIGLIPNCAASIVLTELYLSGAISFASVVAGLCTGAGTGLLVLFRMNHDRKENLTILGMLYGIGAAAGLILEIFL